MPDSRMTDYVVPPHIGGELRSNGPPCMILYLTRLFPDKRTSLHKMLKTILHMWYTVLGSVTEHFPLDDSVMDRSHDEAIFMKEVARSFLDVVNSFRPLQASDVTSSRVRAVSEVKRKGEGEPGATVREAVRGTTRRNTKNPPVSASRG